MHLDNFIPVLLVFSSINENLIFMNNFVAVAVVVTFNPVKDNINRLIHDLLPQVSRIYIIDNGSKDPSFLISESNDAITFICLKDNVGIAEAQNIGIREAFKNAAEFFVFFDQDSSIEENMVNKLYLNFRKLSNNYKVGAVGPVFYNQKHGFIYPQIKLKKPFGRERIIPDEYSEPLSVSFIISSGTFTSRNVIEDVGLMNSDLFIDYVDTEWCLRASAMGYQFYALPEVKMMHSIGDNKIKFLRHNLPVHSPWRRYFRMRNMYILFSLNYIPLSLKVREFFINNAHQIIIILTQKNKLSYLKYWYKSQLDGIHLMHSKKNKR